MPFSQDAADLVCNFFEKVLKHTIGDWYGKPFMLAPWQEDDLSQIFGRIDDQGNRQVSTAYIEVPKKSGKSEMAAGVALWCLISDKNPGVQVYGVAAAQRQALNVYRAACKMVEQSPALSRELRIMRGTNRILKRNDQDSFYAAIAADGDLSDGVNPSCVIADELHRWRNRKAMENWDVLSLGGITRKESLTIGITTAGVQNESPLSWRYHEKARKMQEGVFEDPKFYGRIYGADLDDDWTSERTWIKASPSLKENGGFLDIAKIREVYESSLTNPDEQIAFRRYYLNIWDQKEQRVIDIAQWNAMKSRWTARGLGQKAPEDLVRPLHRDVFAHFVDRPCYIGVDISMTTDMTAVGCVFPYGNEIELLPFVWLPEDGLKKAELRDGMPYRSWLKEGFIETCPGGVVELDDVEARLRWATRVFDVRGFYFDPWNSRQLSARLAKDGFNCVEIPQQMSRLSEPTKKFLELNAAHKIHHGGHPVTRFHASCLSLKDDGHDNVMPCKPRRAENSARIDIISTAVDGLCGLIVDVVQEPWVHCT